MRQPVVLLGPTAAGKSAVALRVAQELDGEIVNADALQVYRGLDIGTAKPSAADRATVRHHLVDILDPWEPCSAGELARRGRAAIADIQSRGRLPVVVGGSGLYLRALLDGISEMPPIDPRLRAWLVAASRREGLPALRRWLRALDPESAARTTEGDTQRTLRALEIALGSGRSQGWWNVRRPPSDDRISALRIGLTLPRAVLYDRQAGRVSVMIAAGWLREIENLFEAGLDPGLPAFQAIGYRQLAQHLRGEISLDQAVDETVRATRRYAKRQLTWFRNEPGVVWFDSVDLGAAAASVLGFIRTSPSGRGHG